MEAVRILRIAAGGDGVGRLADGRTAFVPRSAPGDLIEPVDVRLHARFARARLGRLVEAGPDRITPPCRHYVADSCGGCQLQHLSPGAQREARRTIVGDALRRIGRFDVTDPVLESGTRELNYRVKVTLSLDSSGTRAGFYRLGEAGEVFDLLRCEIADQRLNELWLRVRELRPAWPPALRQMVLRVGRDDRLHLVFRGPVPPGSELLQSVQAIIWWEPPDGTRRQLTDAPATGAQVPPGVFEQVHPEMGDRVRNFAIDELGSLEGRHVWDLYAGIGETTAGLLRKGASVESVELDHDAVREAELRGPRDRVRRYAGRVEDVLTRLDRPDAVVTNPPRAGMDRKVVRGIKTAAPGVVLYISCDPATLARDLSSLADRYRIASLRSFDLFPQTAHVETVVRLDHQ